MERWWWGCGGGVDEKLICLKDCVNIENISIRNVYYGGRGGRGTFMNRTSVANLVRVVGLSY